MPHLQVSLTSMFNGISLQVSKNTITHWKTILLGFKVKSHETFMNLLLELKGMYISRGVPPWPHDEGMRWVFMGEDSPGASSGEKG